METPLQAILTCGLFFTDFLASCCMFLNMVGSLSEWALPVWKKLKLYVCSYTHEGRDHSYNPGQRWEVCTTIQSTCGTMLTGLFWLCSAWCLYNIWVKHFTCTALLLSYGFCRSLLKQASVGGAEKLSRSPRECGRSAINLACVEASNIWLCIRYLHPRAMEKVQASCPFPRSNISYNLPQDSSSACRNA